MKCFKCGVEFEGEHLAMCRFLQGKSSWEDVIKSWVKEGAKEIARRQKKEQLK